MPSSPTPKTTTSFGLGSPRPAFSIPQTGAAPGSPDRHGLEPRFAPRPYTPRFRSRRPVRKPRRRRNLVRGRRPSPAPHAPALATRRRRPDSACHRPPPRRQRPALGWDLRGRRFPYRRRGPHLAAPIVTVWSLASHRGPTRRASDLAGLFESRDGGETWSEVEGLRQHPTRPHWQPGGAGLTLHAIVPHPEDNDQLWVGISAAGVFHTADGGRTWQPRSSRSGASLRTAALHAALPISPACSKAATAAKPGPRSKAFASTPRARTGNPAAPA